MTTHAFKQMRACISRVLSQKFFENTQTSRLQPVSGRPDLWWSTRRSTCLKLLGRCASFVHPSLLVSYDFLTDVDLALAFRAHGLELGFHIRSILGVINKQRTQIFVVVFFATVNRQSPSKHLSEPESRSLLNGPIDFTVFHLEVMMNSQ